MKKDSGFIEIIVIVIVFVLTAFYFGKDPLIIWESVKPILEFALDLFVKSIEFLITLISKIWDGLR